MDKEKFVFVSGRPSAPVTAGRVPGSAAEGFSRFVRNRSSVVAAVILFLLLLFALLTPLFSPYTVGSRDGYYRRTPPLFAPNIRLSGPQALRDYYDSMGAITDLEDRSHGDSHYYSLTINAYRQVGYVYVDLSRAEFERLQAYQTAEGRQVLYPIPKNHATFYPAVKSSANLWYVLKDPGTYSTGESAYHRPDGSPVFVADYLSDETDNVYHSLRLAEDPGHWVYAVANQTGYRCRVDYAAYYRYRNGTAPLYLLGTNQHGQDILTCLAAGARLSFLLSIGVSAINLCIGLIYGAIEGYFGGKTDLIMERLADILGAIPFIVVATLFQLHLAQQVGPVICLLFSFVLTGWIGIAGRVRTQFYRFKGAEYVLSAGTLGASHRRLIFRHILPNALGTIITSAVLLIPGVIFSESMLSYLGIVNFETDDLTSLGTMLANGRAYLSSAPYIPAIPAIFVALLEISFNLMGNGLRDALNPMLKEG